MGTLYALFTCVYIYIYRERERERERLDSVEWRKHYLMQQIIQLVSVEAFLKGHVVFMISKIDITLFCI